MTSTRELGGRAMAIDGICSEILGILQSLGLLQAETPVTLKEKIAKLDGEEEFVEQWESNRRGTLSTVALCFDPNALLNPAERTRAVAAWQPPLWRDLGFLGSYDPKTRRVRIERQGRLLADEPAVHDCHAAVAWNKALADQGLEVLVLDLGTDDESFLAVSKAGAERIRRENILAVARPCPMPKK
jgi:hypothetical protein